MAANSTRALDGTRAILSLVVPVVLVGLSPGVSRPEDAGKRPARVRPRGAKKGVELLALDETLAKARERYLPALLYYDGGDGYEGKKDDLPSRWRRNLESVTFRKALRAYSLGRVETADLARKAGSVGAAAGGGRKAGGKKRGGKDRRKEGQGAEGADPDLDPDETVGDRFGIVEGIPSVVLLDFRQRVARRYVGDLPSATKLRRMLLAFAVKNKRFAGYARKAEKVLEQASYAYALGKKRAAVQKLLPFESPKERKKMDPVLRRRIDRRIAVIRADARALMEKALDLDRRKKYADAINVLDAITRDYPFPDLVRQANQKRGEILRKAKIGI